MSCLPVSLFMCVCVCMYKISENETIYFDGKMKFNYLFFFLQTGLFSPFLCCNHSYRPYINDINSIFLARAEKKNSLIFSQNRLRIEWGKVGGTIWPFILVFFFCIFLSKFCSLFKSFPFKRRHSTNVFLSCLNS